jgi:hypothetical protein
MVDFLMVQGIRQFLDLRSGIPTVSNVHEQAQRKDPVTRAVYVGPSPVDRGKPGSKIHVRLTEQACRYR